MMNEGAIHLFAHSQAAIDARSFVEGVAREDFLADKRTQQAVIMSFIIIGEAATKIMDGYTAFTEARRCCPNRCSLNGTN
jgi:uncharacterized protein with HEPN domain